MEGQVSPSDPFRALCKIASTNNWCWKIHCGTCGHRVFHHGLIDIACGADPSEPNWSFNFDVKHKIRKDPGRWLESIENQDRLIDVVRKTDIRSIAAVSPFPDWLGYLGLVLSHTEESEVKNRKLSLSWTPQLIDLVMEESAAWNRLHEIFKYDVIKWHHLGLVELDCKDLDNDLGFL